MLFCATAVGWQNSAALLRVREINRYVRRQRRESIDFRLVFFPRLFVGWKKERKSLVEQRADSSTLSVTHLIGRCWGNREKKRWWQTAPLTELCPPPPIIGAEGVGTPNETNCCCRALIPNKIPADEILLISLYNLLLALLFF